MASGADRNIRESSERRPTDRSVFLDAIAALKAMAAAEEANLQVSYRCRPNPISAALPHHRQHILRYRVERRHCLRIRLKRPLRDNQIRKFC